MEKIPTIFERDWEGNRGIVNTRNVPIELLNEATPTEKLDGTNVRITVRNHSLVRLEKRRNPTQLEKVKGITEPWYTEAYEQDAQDKWIWDAARNTDLSDIEDGEYSGEAIGKNIQGNPLNLDENIVFLFQHKRDLGKVMFIGCPLMFDDLKEWLPKQKSKFGNDCQIEGLVWWLDGKPVGKIKLKDFK